MLYQHDAPALSVTTEDDTNPVFATSIDTHFLLAGVPFASATGIGAPEEDTAVAVSIEPSDAPNPFDAIAQTSFGGFLTMTGTRTGTVGNIWDLGVHRGAVLICDTADVTGDPVQRLV